MGSIPRLAADDLLAMAEQIERNGRDFYRSAAALVADDGTRGLLGELAAWEEDHEADVIRLRAGLTAAQRTLEFFGASGDQVLFLNAVADAHVFRTDADVESLLAGFSTVADVLSFAMRMERDSVLFFMGLRGTVPVELGRQKIDDLVNDEMAHVASLKSLSTRLETGGGLSARLRRK